MPSEKEMVFESMETVSQTGCENCGTDTKVQSIDINGLDSYIYLCTECIPLFQKAVASIVVPENV